MSNQIIFSSVDNHDRPEFSNEKQEFLRKNFAWSGL